MKVVIEGVRYVPEPPQAVGGDELEGALGVRFDSDIGDDITIRDYLRELLTTLWREGGGFSGKRPFGNSGWQFDLYGPLIDAGYLPGTTDEYGHVSEVDDEAAHAYVLNLILALCAP